MRGDDGRPSRGIVLLAVVSVVDDSPLPPRNKHHERFALTFDSTFDPRFLAASVVDIVVVVHHQHKTSRDKITTKKTNLWPLLLNWLPPHPTPPIVAAPSPSPPLPPTLRRLG